MEQRRTAIISGGCGDVGSAIGKKLSEDGFDIVALYLTTPRARAEAALARFAPGRHEAILCDLRDGRTVAVTVADVIKTRGRLDACIHAAVDPVVRKNILELEEAELRDQLATAFWGAFHLYKAAAPVMKKEGEGIIIGILSRVIEPAVRYARMAGNTVAKHALRGLLKELHGELAATRITVNGIAPDFMDTGLNKDLPDAVRKFIAGRAVTGSIRSPDDVARAVSYLCSNEGRAVNGKIFSFEEKEVCNL
jgi:NAD(P)-dependent dehydrogenase (short-subunit alcohol dehydrogenase family)